MNANMLACFFERPRILATSAVSGITVPGQLARPEEPEPPSQQPARRSSRMVIRACLHQTECTAMYKNRMRSTADVLLGTRPTGRYVQQQVRLPEPSARSRRRV